jgi:hypothetical protein
LADAAARRNVGPNRHSPLEADAVSGGCKYVLHPQNAICHGKTATANRPNRIGSSQIERATPSPADDGHLPPLTVEHTDILKGTVKYKYAPTTVDSCGFDRPDHLVLFPILDSNLTYRPKLAESIEESLETPRSL